MYHAKIRFADHLVTQTQNPFRANGGLRIVYLKYSCRDVGPFQMQDCEAKWRIWMQGVKLCEFSRDTICVCAVQHTVLQCREIGFGLSSSGVRRRRYRGRLRGDPQFIIMLTNMNLLRGSPVLTNKGMTHLESHLREFSRSILNLWSALILFTGCREQDV